VILSSNNVTSIIALTMLILLVAASFFVLTYFPNPIAQQIREQTQSFDQDRSNLG
jgi:hypothetical protein